MDDDTPLATTNFAHILHPITVQHLVREWLKEDTPNFDYGGFVVGEQEETAVLLLKSPGVVAGMPFFEAVFKELDCEVTWLVKEGCELEPITEVATVRGKVRRLLLGERVSLNCLSRVSGVATLARRLDKAIKLCGWHGQIAGTRKTTPGFRLPEKYGLLVGGVATHRYDLSSMIMLKDNHIWVAGDVTKAVKDARIVGGFSSKIEVECRSLSQAKAAAGAGADVIMLDNFEAKCALDTACELKAAFPNVMVEASGGITRCTLLDYCNEYIDVISMGKLTQGYDSVDFSLKISRESINPQNSIVTSH